MFDQHHLAVLDLLDNSLVVEDGLSNSENLALISQREAFRKKNLFLIENNAVDQVCLENWHACEKQNFETNQKFRAKEFDFRTRSLLEEARLFLQRTLGVFEYGDFRFTNGSTVQYRGFSANIVEKLSSAPECTKAASADFMNLKYIDPHLFIAMGLYTRTRTSVERSSVRLVPVEGNIFFTVPKNNKTSRPCCMEPLCNLLLQKSISNTLYKRFLHEYQLRSRQSKHRKMLMQPDFVNQFATIDLSSASDTISYELVKYLLPEDWFLHLDRARSRKTVLPDSTIVELEKFSSMGNGFTFELETVIFYALCYAVCKKHSTFSVYGDDIIVPVNKADSVCELLIACGFSPNMEKTFTSGNFRESCGVDVYYEDHRAIDVRPTYLKGTTEKNEIARYISLQNTVYRIATIHSDNTHVILDKRYESVLHYLDSLSRDVNIPIVPFGHEGGFFPLPGYSFGKRSTFLQPHYKRRRLPKGLADVALYAALYGIPSLGVTPRQEIRSYKRKYMRVRCYHRLVVVWA